MNLDGKYIVIRNKEYIKPILNFLYRDGFHWSISGNKEMISYLSIDFHDPIFISSNKKQLWWRFYESIYYHNKNELNIIQFIREEKLKRILK